MRPPRDASKVVTDFADSRVFDHSGLEAIQAVAYRKLLHEAGGVVEVNIHEDPTYKGADGELD